MAEKEIEIENVDESSASLDANIDADALAQAEAEAAQAVESTADAQAAPKTPAPVAEKPKTTRQRSDELFNRVLMGRDKEINNLLNKWGKDKFFKLINENKDNFREDFYKDISGRGIKIPIQEYNGYYTPTYETQKQIVYSDEGLKQIRAEEQQKQKEKRQAEAEIAAKKNEPWYRWMPDMLGSATKQVADTFKKGLDVITETTGKSKILEPLGVNKFFDYLKDSVTGVQRGTSFAEAINETSIPALATGSVDMDFNRIAKQMKDLKEYGPTNVELDFQKHEGGWDTVSDYAKMIIPTILESGSTLIRSGWEETLVTSLAGTPALGGIMAAYHMELFASIVDELEQAKDKSGRPLYDVTNGEDWRRAFSNRAFIEPILEKANTRAAIITGFDMLGAGVFGGVTSRGVKLVEKASKVLPKTLTSPIARGLSKIGQSKKVLTHPAVQQLTNKLGKLAETKVGKVVTGAGAKAKEFADPKEIAVALAGEGTAQYFTTDEIDPESTAMEGLGELSAIKMIARLLGRGRGVLGGGTTAPATPPAPGSPPAPGAAPIAPAGADEYGAVVTDEEYAAYKKDKTLDPERRAAVEEDAIKALDDPEHLKSLQKDTDTDESLRRYYEMVTDAMEQETKYREGEEIMKASIAHVAELNGGIPEKEMLELIDPSNPRFNKDLAGMVERKYAELADAYAEDTGDESFRQKPAAAPAPAAKTQPSGAAQTQAADTRGLAPEIQKGLAAIQKLEEYVGRIDAKLGSIEDTPENQEEIQKILATKKAILQEVEKNKQALKQQGYDPEAPAEAPAATETEVVAEDGEAPQVPGQETVVTEEVVDESPTISPETRALAAKELDPKKLVKDGTLVYKNRKPVYNGREFKNTKELQAFLQTDEGILAAAETNEAIANALGKTSTFTGTTETGGVAGTTTSQTGPAAESVVGAQTAEGATETAPVEPATQKTEDVEVQAEGVKPEGKPRVKGDSQEVVEAFEKAVAAGKKIFFPASGGKTTVQLDKPGQLKADADGGLYIDRGKGKREYLPAGGGEESVIRQQLGVAETAESKKQRKEAVAERNKKAKEQADQKRKSEEAKQAQKKRDMIDRLQKILDTGKSEKGKTISEKERKEVEANIERLKQSIADAEAADKLVKGEEPTTKPEDKPVAETKTEKQPQTKAQEKLQNAIDGAKRSAKGTSLISGPEGSHMTIGGIHNTGNTVIVAASLFADNFDPKIAENDGEGVKVYERVSEYGERENGKLSKAPKVRIMIFNNKADADAYFKERAAKNEKRIKELQEEVDNEGKPQKPVAETETETETATETEPEAPAQYIPLTSKDIEIGKFSKDEAVEYETDEKELESGRMSEYISSMTVEVLNDDGNTVGFLTKLKDEDGTVTWQSSNESGDELGIDEAFDTKQEAIQALLDDYNKEQSKEFAKEQKRLAKEAEKKAAKAGKAIEGKEVKIETLNPTESIFVDYSAEQRDKMPLGKNITTYDKTAGLSPDKKITVYRGVPKDVDKIQSGDFVTTNKQLAQDYAGDGKVISKEVRADELLDDKTEPLGEEYILREKAATTSAPVEITPEQAARNQMAMMDDIMDTERTKPAAAKEMRDQFIEQHGKEVFDKLNKITRNFEQIINTLEKEGKCTKKC